MKNENPRQLPFFNKGEYGSGSGGWTKKKVWYVYVVPWSVIGGMDT